MTPLERYQAFAQRGYEIEPLPYRIRNADMSPGPWKAKVNVLHHSYRETTVQPVWGSEKYIDKTKAESAAFLLGLRWLEEQAG